MRGFALVTVYLCACGASRAPEVTPDGQGSVTQAGSADDASALPPLVLNAQSELHCSISSTRNGRQTLRLTSGQGLEFDVEVSPIVDGVVEARGPEHGGGYRFTSHLAAPGKGTLSGVGEVSFEQLETKVNVAIDRYQQPKGAGTELTFQSSDMAARGIYVEFSGRARAANGERYAFRVNLGAPGPGSGGSVVPANNAYNAPAVSKVVMITAPQTTVVSGLPPTTATTTRITRLR